MLRAESSDTWREARAGASRLLGARPARGRQVAALARIQLAAGNWLPARHAPSELGKTPIERLGSQLWLENHGQAQAR